MSACSGRTSSDRYSCPSTILIEEPPFSFLSSSSPPKASMTKPFKALSKGVKDLLLLKNSKNES